MGCVGRLAEERELGSNSLWVVSHCFRVSLRRGVDSSAKRNALSEPDFDVPAKLGQEGLDG